jgi:PKD repeat protein
MNAFRRILPAARALPRLGLLAAAAPLVAATLLLAAPRAGLAADPADPSESAVTNLAPAEEPVATLDPEWSASFVPPPMPRLRAATACRSLDAVFYSPTDWFRLAQKLRATPSACAQYYVMVPAVTSDKTRFRTGEAARIHALGPQMHVIPEINYTAWAGWVADGNGTFFDAGVEARRRMAEAGYDVSLGDTWGLNELSSAVRTGAGAARQNVRELIRGLYVGDGGDTPVPGAVWTTGIGQSTGDLSTYKTALKGWLGDAAFWADVAQAVRFWSQETYGDVRRWAVPGADLAARRDRLVDYHEHVSVLASVAPFPDVKAFLLATDTPNANAAWAYTTGFGYTLVPYAQMKAYVAAQTYALRHYQGSVPWREADSFGFAWSPTNALLGLPTPEYQAATAAILDQLAASIHASEVPNEEDPGIGACGPDGSWCAADIDGASLNDAWKILGTWTQPVARDSTATVAEDATAVVPLDASDADGEPLTYEVLTQPANGTLAGDGAARTYTPAPDFNGTDSFTFRVNDGAMNSRIATVRITVTPVNDAPVVELAPAGPVDEGAAPVTLTAQASDVDGDAVTLAWATDVGTVVASGTTATEVAMVVPSTGTATFAADDGPATAHVTVTGDDGHGGAALATTEIEVRNVAPSSLVGTVPGAVWGLPVSLTGSAVDVSLADTAAGLDAWWDFGDASADAEGFAVAHVYADPGTYTATLTVTDKDGGSVEATAAVTVTYTKTVTTTVAGPLRVTAGQSVKLAPGAVVNGPVTVEPGGALDVEGATVNAPVRARGAGWLRFCAARVMGPFEAIAGTGSVLVGDGTPACPPSSFLGYVTIQGNTGGVRIVQAEVHGPLRVRDNHDGAVVTGNTVHGPLTVTGNGGGVVHSPNTVQGPSTLQ